MSNTNITETIAELRSTWTLLFPAVEGPDARQWALWLMIHDTSVVRKAIAKLAVRYETSGEEWSLETLLKFGSSIMNRLSRDAQKGNATATT